MTRKASGSRVYEIRFLSPKGKETSFFTSSNSPVKARRKMRTKGGQILWVRKAI
jgi:hypothetical protein